MTAALPVSLLVNVSVILTPAPAQSQALNDLLILGNSAVIDVVQRIRTYPNIAAVAADFGTTAPEYLAAVLYFEQAPQPTVLKIGRWAQAATAGVLNGAILSAAAQAIAVWNGITTGGFSVTVDGGGAQHISGLNFSAAANLAAVAADITAALAGATCTWNANQQQFQITSATTGAASSVSFLTAPTAGNAYDISGLLGMTNLPSSKAALGAYTVSTPGAAYTALDVATLTGGTFTTAAQVEIVTVSGGGVPNATVVKTPGAYTAIPASPVATTGGSGANFAVAPVFVFGGAYVANGIAAETALAAVQLFDAQFGTTWYAVTVLGIVDGDIPGVANYIEAASSPIHLLGVSTQEAGVLSSVSTTDIAYILAQLKLTRTVVQYSSSNPYSVCSLLGRTLTVDYGGNNTTITLMYKQEPGIVAENLTVTQLNSLLAKNCNAFLNYNNNTAIIQQGRMSSGLPIDVRTGVDWLSTSIQTAVYNLLYTSTTKIPQTDNGNHLIVTTIESVCSQGVTNGLLAPGQWNAGGFGSLNQGDWVPAGYYVYAPPIITQAQADRAARKSVPFQIAAKLAGAVETVGITLNVNQ